MAILSYFPHCNSPFKTGFYLPVKTWIIVSTSGFNLFKESGFVKEMQCKQPPVYTTHLKPQKELWNGLNLCLLNYRHVRPGILSEGSGKTEKEGLIVVSGGCCGSDPHPVTPTLSALLPAHVPHYLTTAEIFGYPSSTHSTSPPLF